MQADLTKKYESRLRHKTKPDKYEYKHKYKRRRAGTPPIVAKKAKRSRRKKDAVTLHQEFKAPNIETSRITLDPGLGPGIFNKGKISSSQKGCGVPDLTFPEMSFLKEKRKSDNTQFKTRRVAQNSKGRLKGNVLEISQHFDRLYNGYRIERDVRSSHSSPAKLIPERSNSRKSWQRTHRKAHSLLTQNRRSSQNHQGATKLILEPGQLYLSHHVSAKSATHPRPSDGRTSYISWSVTPRRDVNKQLDNARQENLGCGEDLLRTTEDLTRTPKSVRQPVSETPSRDSISNPSLHRYTRRLLFDQKIPHSDEHEPICYSRLLSLEDLKDLAQFSELDCSAGDRLFNGSEFINNVQESQRSKVNPTLSSAQRNESERPANHLPVSRADLEPTGQTLAEVHIQSIPARRDIGLVPERILHTPVLTEHGPFPRISIWSETRARGEGARTGHQSSLSGTEYDDRRSEDETAQHGSRGRKFLGKYRLGNPQASWRQHVADAALQPPCLAENKEKTHSATTKDVNMMKREDELEDLLAGLDSFDVALLGYRRDRDGSSGGMTGRDNLVERRQDDELLAPSEPDHYIFRPGPGSKTQEDERWGGPRSGGECTSLDWGRSHRLTGEDMRGCLKRPSLDHRRLEEEEQDEFTGFSRPNFLY